MLTDKEITQINAIRAIVSSHEVGEKTVDAVMKRLKQEGEGYHWVGVYVLKGADLHVGPYYGPKTDHTVIPVGRGVCGTAVAQNANQVVEDVQAIENYLACNMETRSEIVVLIRDPDGSGKVLGQIDIDGTKVGLFNKQLSFLEEVAQLLGPSVKKLQESM